jgi:hypothetical protein
MDSAYIEILDTNKELRKELEDEIAENKLKDKKLKSLSRELESCYRILSHQDSSILAHEDEIASLKSEIKSLKQRLHKALQDLRHKGDASTAQDIHILRLEDKVDQLKKRIRDITDKKIQQSNNYSTPMALSDLLANIGIALDRVENYIGGDTTINPINTLNGIRITLTNIRGHMQRTTQDALNNRNLLNTANGRFNTLMNDLTNARNDILRREQMMTQAWRDERRERQLGDAEIIDLRNTVCRNVREKCWWKRRYTAYAHQARNLKRYYQQYKDETDWDAFWALNKYQKWKARELNSRQIIFNLQNNPPPIANMATMVDVNKLLRPQLSALPFYDGQEEPDSYYAKLRTINESARALAVGGFNFAERANMMKGKMTGRFHPVPAQNPYNANNAINNEAEFLNWLQGKYQEVMVGTNRDALKALINEKFTIMDTSDTYEKRIKPYAQGILYADVLPYLYEHMPQYMEMRLRQTAPANLDAFFTNLRTIWLECRGRNMEQTPPISQTLAIQPQRSEAEEDWLQLAKDLDYTDVSKDYKVSKAYIYDNLGKRLGYKTAHIRRSPFAESRVINTNATKKVVKRVVQKVPSKSVRHCSICGNTGHTKVNCPGVINPVVKRTKKVNYIYQPEEENPEESEEEYIIEEVEEEEIEDDDENVDDDDNESRNCYAVKKKWCEEEYL